MQEALRPRLAGDAEASLPFGDTVLGGSRESAAMCTIKSENITTAAIFEYLTLKCSIIHYNVAMRQQ